MQYLGREFITKNTVPTSYTCQKSQCSRPPLKSSRLEVRSSPGPRRVLPCSRHRKHWLVSCRGSVRCRSTAGAKRAGSKHGSRETFQSDRHACIRHGSWVPKAPAGWTPCSQRAAHAAVRASWAHSLAARSRTRRGSRARGAAQHTGGATGRGQARGAASDLVCHLPPHARAQGGAVHLQRKRGAALLELGPAREHPLAAQRCHRERARHVAI